MQSLHPPETEENIEPSGDLPPSPTGTDRDDHLMPSGCAGNIDLIHADKGKIITIGSYPEGSKQNPKDEVCLFSKYADDPLLSLNVQVPRMNGVDYVSVTHHGLPIRINPVVAMMGILYALPAQKGTRFDVGFSGGASCRFAKSDPAYPVKRPTREKPTANPELAEQRSIFCTNSAEEPAKKTADNTVQKERLMGKKGVLKEFIDADKFNEDNKTRFTFNGEGIMTFRPQYFTEQWFMIGTGGQMKSHHLFGNRKHENWFASKWKRLNREVKFLFDGGEKTSYVDFAGDVVYGDAASGDAREVGSDPDTHVVNMAFIDPAVVNDVSIDVPRYGKGQSMDVSIKPDTTCEMRTNFKRRPATIMDNILFCTKLDKNDDSFNKKAQKFMSGFELEKREKKNGKK